MLMETGKKGGNRIAHVVICPKITDYYLAIEFV
jgi:hypothetical protein